MAFPFTEIVRLCYAVVKIGGRRDYMGSLDYETNYGDEEDQEA